MLDGELYRLGAAEIVQGIAARLFSAEEVVRSCLSRIAERGRPAGV